ncbi:MAG: AAA family ATPase [Polyangiaceae bacterium]
MKPVAVTPEWLCEDAAVPSNAVAKRRSKVRELTFVDAAKLAEPLPDLPYLVSALGIAGGAATLFAGYGFGGKSMAAQSFAISCATGRPLWGVYGVKQCPVAHLDWEQGHRVTAERYQRLARAEGLGLSALASLPLKLCVHPEIGLEAADAEDVYSRAFGNAGLVIVDSLRAAAPTADENSSEIRRYIDVLNRSAEKTGATVVIIHHARKPSADASDGARYKIRGSGAIFDACGSVFVFSAEKGAATRVSHEKCRNKGILGDDFGLRIEDVEVNGDPRGGLRLTHLEAEQLAADAPAQNQHAGAMERISAHLAAKGEFRGSKTALAKELHIGNASFYPAFSVLESSGLVVSGRDATGQFVRRGPVSEVAHER